VSRSRIVSLGMARWPLLGVALFMSACDPLSLASLFESETTGVSVLVLLSTDDRNLEIGSEVQGTLSPADYVGVNESYLEAWAFEGTAGERVSVDLMSDDFDSHLYVVGPGLGETLRDDDGGGACHARLDFTVLESGVFHIVASSSTSRQTGTYRLRVSGEARPRAAISCGGVDGQTLSSLPTSGRVLRLGEQAFGRMTGAESSIEDGRPVQAWTLEGVVGETVTVRLESDDYDAYLYIFGPGMAQAMTNDDGGGDLDSEITITFSVTGTYTVGASALSSGAVGSYILVVSEPIDLATLSTEGRRLQVGSHVTGVLTATDPVAEGKPVQAWAFEASAGDLVTIDLVSDDFDSYLQVAGPGLSQVMTNDDGGDGLHSRLSVSFPQDGVYRIIASSLGRSTGAFSLQVQN
jgi:hypothetical protein